MLVSTVFVIRVFLGCIASLVAAAGLVAKFGWTRARGEGGLARSLGWAHPPFGPGLGTQLFLFIPLLCNYPW